jgi:hypothetical protein
MRISGHRTDATFRRYNITSEEDLRDAIHKTSEIRLRPPKERMAAIVTGAEAKK